MNLWFVDDSRHAKPSRPGMGALVSAGGLCIPEGQVRNVETELEALCGQTGFGRQEEFKWSPGRELWMHKQLVGDARMGFFREAMQIANASGAVGIWVGADSSKGRATNDAPDSETDVVRMLLERIHNVTPAGELALVIADRPGGAGVPASDQFVATCLKTIREGTNVLSTLDRIALVLTCGSNLVRCMQLADVFTSCIAALVSGETNYAPLVAPSILPVLRTQMGRVGGYGVKLHPDFSYVNLYHWLFSDEDFWRGSIGWALPMKSRPYANDPFIP
jgi:hypothetical protein